MAIRKRNSVLFPTTQSFEAKSSDAVRTLGVNKPTSARDAQLAKEIAMLPRMPSTLTEKSYCDWLRQLMDVMHPKSGYRKRLSSLLQQYEYQVKKANS